jgi:hypothetical protein
MTNTIPFPDEDAFGFAGTIQANSHNDATGANGIGPDAARRLWREACAAVARTFGEDDPAVIRNFLRSRYGRHLADEAYTEAHPAQGEAALAAGIGKALARKKRIRQRLGGTRERLAWQKPFDEIKTATLDGTWTE